MDNLVSEPIFKVSVVIPIYNGETDLPELIKCLYQQTYPASKVEYLLVDNNSSDRTPEIIETAIKEAKIKGIKILHLSEPKIQSSYAARNQGIKASQAEIIAFTDVDCRPESTWLEKLIIPFTDTRVGIVVGEVLGLSGKTLLEKYAEHYGVMSQKFVLEHPFCPYGQTANLAIRKQAFVDVGLFRSHLTTGGDADICWRILRETNWKIEFAPQGIIRHRHRQNFTELHSQWRRYGRSNRYLHQLYGVDLMRELNPKQLIYRLSRWLLKEFPLNSIKLISGKSHPLDLIRTPIDLFCFHARTRGQQESQLPELAREIEYL